MTIESTVDSFRLLGLDLVFALQKYAKLGENVHISTLSRNAFCLDVQDFLLQNHTKSESPSDQSIFTNIKRTRH